MTDWTPDALVLDGRYASMSDWFSALAEFREVASEPCGVCVYSGRFMLPSLSVSWGFDGLTDQMMAELAGSFRLGLAAADEAQGLLQDLIRGTFGRTVRVAHLTRHPSHIGDLAVTMFGSWKGQFAADASRVGRRLALCALGSIVAVAHRENAYEQVMRSIMDSGGRDDYSDSVDLASPLASQASLGEVPRRFVGLQRSRLISYFATDLRDLDLCVYVLREGNLVHDSGDCRALLLPSEVECLSPPEVTEHDWLEQAFRWRATASLPPFADAASLLRQAHLQERRLFGTLNGHVAMAAPFGAVPSRSDRRRQPSGLLLAVRASDSVRVLPTHAEMTCLKALETRLARSAADERWFGTIAQLSERVQTLSGQQSPHPSMATSTCCAALADRRDAKIVSGLVARILDDLIVTTGAISATCRLVVGAGPEVGVRQLARLAAAGGPAKLDSPDSIVIDQGNTESVNSWVARNGVACYLRRIPEPTAHDELGEARARWTQDYPGLTGPALFRAATRSELCVPVRADGRLVGTINLESASTYGFDESAHAVEEYAQVVGLAIRMARREISVEMLEEAEGFLDRRHSLAGEIDVARRSLSKEGSPSSAVREALSALDQAEELLAASISVGERSGASESLTGLEVLDAELRRLGRFRGVRLRPRDLIVDSSSGELLDLALDWLRADALGFAMRQVLSNALDHGLRDGRLGHVRPPNWPYDVIIRVGELMLGGRRNLVVGVQNACFIDDLNRAGAERIFREPIRRADGREHMGAFLAGEAMRRCGGAASFVRAGQHNANTVLVTSELAVPVVE